MTRGVDAIDGSPQAVPAPTTAFDVGVAQLRPLASQPAMVAKACAFIEAASAAGVKLLTFSSGLFRESGEDGVPKALRSCIAQAKVVTCVPVKSAGGAQSVAIVGADGSTLGVHRKIIPQGSQNGNGRDLLVVNAPGVGRVCALIGNEAWLLLARYTLYTQNCQYLVLPTEAVGTIWTSTIKSIAREGRMYVLSVGAVERNPRVVNRYVLDGGAMVANPQGQTAAGPIYSACSLCDSCAAPPTYSLAWAKAGCPGHDVLPPSLPAPCAVVTVPGYDDEFVLTSPTSLSAILMSKTYEDNVGNYASKWVWEVKWLNKRT